MRDYVILLPVGVVITTSAYVVLRLALRIIKLKLPVCGIQFYRRAWYGHASFSTLLSDQSQLEGI